MGRISNKLAKQFRKASRKRTAVQHGIEIPTGVRDLGNLVKQGYNPLHAAYIVAQNVLSAFAEQISTLREFKPYADIVGTAEDEYLPDGPPFSPLTRSYFTTWAFCDVQFGKDNETMAGCLIDVAELLDINPFFLEVLRAFQHSRMGMYEHCGHDKNGVRLRELVTNELLDCHVGTGYPGKAGQIWYVRLCPPVCGLAERYVAFTTPYILVDASKADWTAYLNKSLIGVDDSDRATALHEFMKYGRTPTDWSEFVFQAYHHYQTDAIFLAGLPDVPDSLPHSESILQQPGE